MKIVIDMNLSPVWVSALEDQGFQCVHWSTVGDARAADSVILKWARDNGYVVFTNDLDFGAILAASQAPGPSVIQLRSQNITPGHLLGLLVRALQDHAAVLEQGALISIDESRLRTRILPLAR
ncbi:MAG: DUF5615 family PIN-like protein [Dehalococcoidia bacterium]